MQFSIWAKEFTLRPVREQNMTKRTKAEFPTSLGVFSPAGRLVMAFTTDDDARKAQQALITGGIESTQRHPLRQR